MKESMTIAEPSPKRSPSAPDEHYVLAIDLGSGGPKAAVVSDSGAVRASASEKVALHLLPHGGVEQEPEEWWSCVKRTAQKAIRDSGVSPERILAVSCDSQYFVIVPIMKTASRSCGRSTGLIRGVPPIIPALSGV